MGEEIRRSGALPPARAHNGFAPLLLFQLGDHQRVLHRILVEAQAVIAVRQSIQLPLETKQAIIIYCEGFVQTFMHLFKSVLHQAGMHSFLMIFAAQIARYRYEHLD